MHNVRVTNGHNGGAYFADTNAHAGDWAALHCITDTVISAITGNVSGLTGVTFPAGTILYGRWSTFTLTSGSVIAYIV